MNNVTKNPRAFFKKIPLKKMSGQQKFLAVAFTLVGEETTESLTSADVKKSWAKGVLGNFHPYYYQRAQDDDFVEPEKRGASRFYITEVGMQYIKSLINEEKASIRLRDKTERVTLYEKYDFHPKIKEVSFNQFQDGYFKESIQNALVEVICQVKENAGNPFIEKNGRRYALDGEDLMNHVFGCENRRPIIKFNDLSTSLQRAEQRGIMHLYKGVVGVRDKKAHLNFLQNDPLKTIEYLSLASLLMRLLEEAEVNTE